jgi:hypothetical protein
MDQNDRMDELAAAQDLRRQIQEKYGGHDRKEVDVSAQTIPEFMSDHADFLTKVAVGMGYVGDQATAFLRQTQDRLTQTVLPSALDEPMFHTIIATHCEEIETVCRSLKLPLRSGVAFGVNPGIGLEVAQHPVPMTEASIVSVSKMFFPFCGIISKALSRSLPHDITPKLARAIFSMDRMFENINSEPALKTYWVEVIASFALFGTPTLIRPDVISGPLAVTRARLMVAMELFAIAHEYGHHIAYKGPVGEASVGAQRKDGLYSDEFEADYLACVVCSHVGLRQTPQNHYCLWGVGGVLVLKSLELVRRARYTLLSGADHAPALNTHPPVADRIRAMDAFNDLAPKDQKGPSEELREFFGEAFDRMWRGLFPVFSNLHSLGIRPVESSSSLEGWLSC